MLDSHYAIRYFKVSFDFYGISYRAANCQLQTVYCIMPTAYLQLLIVYVHVIDMKGLVENYLQKGYIHCVRNHHSLNVR
jgi:hypothetical protein